VKRFSDDIMVNLIDFAAPERRARRAPYTPR